MTETEWDACAEATVMLEFLRAKASDRKLRLFAVACCNRIRHLLYHEDVVTSAEVAERFAEGKATNEELEKAHELAMWAGDDASWRSMRKACAAWTAASASHKVSWFAAVGVLKDVQSAYGDEQPTGDRERVAQVHLVRDIFGNHFRTIMLDPSRLAWNDGAVCKMAQAIYDDRAFDRLPLLGDALEDAGCTDPAILMHCREQGEHVRGCWVVDLLLGKT